MLSQARLILDAGGPVMYVLLAMSLISLTLTIERTLFWAVRNGPRTRPFRAAVGDALRAGEPSSALTLAGGQRSIYARFVAMVLSGAARIGEGTVLARIEQLRPAIERYGTTHAAIIAGAPLLGILGTVLGIIQSFGLLGAAETISDPTAVAAGIAQALYTTAFGLIVALITLFPHAVFRAQSARCVARLEALGAAIVG